MGLHFIVSCKILRLCAESSICLRVGQIAQSRWPTWGEVAAFKLHVQRGNYKIRQADNAWIISRSSLDHITLDPRIISHSSIAVTAVQCHSYICQRQSSMCNGHGDAFWASSMLPP
eukprot:1139779-Pelagomonas_calceolata.AAC.2